MGLRGRAVFARPDPDNEDGTYATPENAAMSDPLRGDEVPPNIVAAARPSETLGLYIDVHRFGDYEGYQLVTTEFDFESTHASEHASLDEAKARAAELTGLSDLDWQPWAPTAQG